MNVSLWWHKQTLSILIPENLHFCRHFIDMMWWICKVIFYKYLYFFFPTPGISADKVLAVLRNPELTELTALDRRLFAPAIPGTTPPVLMELNVPVAAFGKMPPFAVGSPEINYSHHHSNFQRHKLLYLICTCMSLFVFKVQGSRTVIFGPPLLFKTLVLF